MKDNRMRTGFLAGMVVAGLVAAAAAASQSPAAPPDAGVAAVLASHKAADDAYANAPMSPFTAVAVQYFQPGQTVRLGTGPNGAAFGAAPAGPEIVDLSLEDGAFRVTPVSGARPFVVRTSGDGDVSGLPGVAVTARTTLAPRDVLHLGRFFVELLAGGSTANARVFDPEAPSRKAYAGLAWYPPNLALRVAARFVAAPAPSALTMATSRGLEKQYFRVGTFEFTVDGAPLRLTALATGAAPKVGDELFVAFRDGTTGRETYDVGRYLFIPFAGSDDAYVLDFNKASNPLCNYSPHYNCPIPLKENVLPLAIRAGEMKYPVRH
jgi:uncharacterized protein